MDDQQDLGRVNAALNDNLKTQVAHTGLLMELLSRYPEFLPELENGIPTGFNLCPICDHGGHPGHEKHAPDCLRVLALGNSAGRDFRMRVNRAKELLKQGKPEKALAVLESGE